MDAREFYEAMAPLAREKLETLRDCGDEPLERLRVESVEVGENADAGVHLAVLFRDTCRPDCLFGWTFAWLEEPREEELDFAASLLVTNLEEDVIAPNYGLPESCVEGGVTWF
jgi:hypothetical protein